MDAGKGIINCPTMLTNAPIYRAIGCKVSCEQSANLLNRYYQLPLAQKTETAPVINNSFYQITFTLAGIAGLNTLNRTYQMSDQPLIAPTEFWAAKLMINKQCDYAQAEHWFNIWLPLTLLPVENTVKHLVSIAKNHRAVSQTYWPITPTLSARVNFSGLDPPLVGDPMAA